jgi:hypothetical protein
MENKTISYTSTQQDAEIYYSHEDVLYDGDGKIEVCAIELHIGQNKILIVSCYRQPHLNRNLRVWKKLFAQFKGKFLIGRYFNAHHQFVG